MSQAVEPDANRPTDPSGPVAQPAPLSLLWSEKVLRWLLFGVSFATLPIMANFIFVITQALSPTLPSLAGQGELLIVSAGVAATGAGELQGAALAKLRRVQIFLTAMAYMVVCVSSLWFASVATDIATRRTFDHSTVAGGSLVIFATAIVTGGCCVAISGLRPE